MSVRNYAAAGGDFEPLYCLEVLERGSGGKTTEVFRTADGLELQFTYVGSVKTDGDGPAIYTLLPGAELSVLALPEGTRYLAFSPDVLERIASRYGPVTEPKLQERKVYIMLTILC